MNAWRSIDTVRVVLDVLNSSIFVVQKLALHQNGVEFRQQSIGDIRSCVATLYEVARLIMMSPIYCWRNSSPFWCKASLCTIKIDDFRTLSIGTNLVNNDRPKNDDDVENAMLTGCCFLSSTYTHSKPCTYKLNILFFVLSFCIQIQGGAF